MHGNVYKCGMCIGDFVLFSSADFIRILTRSLGKSKHSIIKCRNCKPDNRTVHYNLPTAKNDSLFADATAKS